MSRSRNWCFTKNNYGEGEAEGLIIKLRDHGYGIIGKEVGESGTPHLQGFVAFKNARTFASMQKWCPGAHFEVAKGTAVQNITYCSKDGNFQEVGVRPKGKGKRTDLEIVKEMVIENKSMAEICLAASSYQSMRAAELMRKYIKPNNHRLDLEVYWFWGPSGQNKTRTAFEMYPNAWVSGETLKWWEGYDGENEIIIDDFRKDFCKFHTLLRYLDIYPIVVPNKGGSRRAEYTRVVITSCFHPEDLYQTREDLTQLTRRLTEIRSFGDARRIPTVTYD